MKRITLIAALACIFSASASAQSVGYNVTGPTAGSTPFLRTLTNSSTTGSTIILDYNVGSTSTNVWSSPVALPFSVDFFGTTQTHFCVSKNGLLTFDTTVKNSNVNTSLNVNTALPNSNLPNNTIAYFWGDFKTLSSGDVIRTYEIGSAPNRQFYVFTYSLTLDDLSFSYNYVVFDEASDDIYFIDAYNGSGTATLTVGVQQNSGKAYQLSGSPNINVMNTSSSTSDDDYYTFSPYNIPTNDAGIVSIDTPGLAPCTLSPLVVTLQNGGTGTLSSANIKYQINNGAVTTYNWTGSISSFGSAQVNVGSPTISSGDFVKVWADSPNGATDSLAANDTSRRTIYQALSGTYTLGGGSANYPTFDSARQDLALRGVCGPVVFDITAGTYTEQVTFTEVTGASATNTITFNGSNAATIKYAPTVSADRHVIRLDGADYFVFDSLNIHLDTGSSYTYGFTVMLMNDASNNTFKNSNILSDLNSTSSSNFAAVIMTGSATSLTTATTGSGNVFNNNTISGGYYGIRLNGTNGAAVGNRIENNNVMDAYAYHVYLASADSTQVTGNDISRVNRGSFTTFYGVYLTSSQDNVFISKNKVHDPFGSNTSTTSAGYAFYFSSADAASGKPNVVANNVVYDMESNGTIYAIYNSGSDGAHYYYNTISLDDVNATGGTTRGVYQTTAATDIVFKNNIFSITRGGTGAKHGFYFNTTTSAITSNKNVVYMASAGSGAQSYGYYSGDQTSLTNWQAANSSAYDQNSYDNDPRFKDPSTVDFKPRSVAFNDSADVISGISTDILGTSRGSNPDPGAFEFTPPPDDAGVVKLVSPVAQCAGTASVIARIRNYGSVTLDSVKVIWSIDGVIQDTIDFYDSVQSANEANVNLGSVTLSSTPVSIRVWTSMPNGEVDLSPGNDTLPAQSVQAAMTGTYTIGTGKDYTTIDAAFTDLETKGVCGAVTFNMDNLTYTEQVILGTIQGASSTNTITFNGNNATLTYGATSTSDRHVLMLDGATYVTFNNLNILLDTSASANPSHGYTVMLLNGANNNTFNNCKVLSLYTSTSTNYAAFVASGSATSNSTTTEIAGLTINNSIIQGGYYAIRLNGNGSSSYNNQILNSTIIDGYTYQVYLTGVDSAIVRGNDVSRPNRPQTLSTFYGLYLTGSSQNCLFEGNKIHDPMAQDETDNSTVYGIYHTSVDAPSGKENKVINNLVYNFNAGGDVYGIYNSSSDGVYYYHNTIVFDDANSSGITRGVYQTSLASNIEIKNNIIYITRGGSGTFHGMYFNTSTSTITHDYNVILVNGANATNNTGRTGGSDYATLADWQTGSTQAANSIDNDPSFSDPSGNDYKPLSVKVNNKGTNLGVATDIDGNSRNVMNPDPGSYEFNPSQKDVRISAMPSPAAGGCGDSNVNVQVIIENLGLDDQYIIPFAVDVTGSTNASLSGIFNDTLLSGESKTVNVSGVVNTTTGGVFTFKAYTQLGGDQRASNDTLTTNITFDTIPAAPVSNDAERCGPGNVPLSASAAAGTISWYDSPSATTAVTTGTSYTPNLSATKSYYLEARSQKEASLTTYFTGTTNTFTGNFFDVTPKNKITLDSIYVHLEATVMYTVEVYYRLGSYDGVEGNRSQWIQLDSFLIMGNGQGNSTPCNVNNLVMNANQVYGIYINVEGASSEDIVYSSGSATFENDDVKLETGKAINGEFAGTTVLGPRTWNGTLIYKTEGCPSPRTMVTATINAIPSNNVVLNGGTDICDGESTELQSDDESNVSYVWTLNGQAISGAVGANYTVFATGDYKMIATSNGGCIDSSSVVSITVNDLPDALIDKSGTEQVCDGDSLTIGANTGTGLTYQWMVGGLPILNADQVSFEAKSSGTYNVMVTDANNCSAQSDTVVVNVNALPASLTGTGANGCEGTDVILMSSPTSPISSIWYDAMAGGNQLATTNNYTVSSVSANGTVYLAAFDGLCESPRTAVNYTVDAAPTVSTTMLDTVCDNDSATIEVSASAGTIEWFDAMTGGVSIGTGATLIQPATLANNTFYAQADDNGCISLTRTAVTVSVNEYPATPVGVDTSACTGSDFATTAMANMGNITWSADSLGTMPVTTGNMLMGTANATDTFWVVADNEGCASAAAPVVITALEVPAIPTPLGDYETCEGNAVTVTATSADNVEWFDATSGGTSLGTGSNLFIPAVNNNTVVYAEANNGNCVSERAQVVIVANPIPGSDFTVISTQGSRLQLAVNNPIVGVNYTWDFGDGETGSGDTVYHDFAANGTYTITVTAVNPITFCESTSNNDVDMQTVGVVTIGNVALNYTVYPNPYHGNATVSIDLNQTADVTIEVYDVSGRKVATLADGTQTAGNNTYTLNTGDTASVSGVYYVRITVNGQVTTIKVVDLGK